MGGYKESAGGVGGFPSCCITNPEEVTLVSLSLEVLSLQVRAGRFASPRAIVPFLQSWPQLPATGLLHLAQPYELLCFCLEAGVFLATEHVSTSVSGTTLTEEGISGSWQLGLY